MITPPDQEYVDAPPPVSVTLAPVQTAAAVLVAVTTGNGFTVTVVVDEAAEVPQALVAVTEIFPLVALAVVIIEFVVEVPVQPPGNVQL